jgi:ribosomal protein L19E
MSSLKLQKRLAASVMKCGKNKVRWSSYRLNVVPGYLGHVRDSFILGFPYRQ